MSAPEQTMRCWVSGKTAGVDGLEWAQIARPQAKPGTVVVEVRGAALNFSDILMVDDTYQVRPSRPFTPGQEVAGVVVEAGKDSRWKPGDRIASKVDWGGFAEYAEVRDDMAIAVPEGVSFAQAAALPVVYTTSMVALHHCASVGPTDTVLVHAAAGGVGLAAVEIAHAAGAKVIATAGSMEKRDLALKHGADHAVDYGKEDWKDRVNELTGGKGATLIIDPVGGDVAIQSLRCIARYGTLLIVGFASGQIAKLPSNYLLLKCAKAQGVLWDHDEDAGMVADMTARLHELWQGGQINPVVDERFTLEELPHALEALGNRDSAGKIVLKT